jgi:hypothetical protein
MANGASSIYFALSNKELPEVTVKNFSVNELVKKYSFIRHDKFDWHVRKNFSTRYLIECQANAKNLLPIELTIFKETIHLNWLLFPQAVKELVNGKEKNFLQLAVQYISNGGIDESVIAADFDEAFLKTLQNKLGD